MNTNNTAAFKACDIRGRLPDELNVDLAYRIGRAYAEFLQPARVVVGYDIRLSSPELAEAVVRMPHVIGEVEQVVAVA